MRSSTLTPERSRIEAALPPALFLLLWSSGFTFVAMGLPHAEPVTFLALRYVAVVGLLAVAAAVLRPPLPRGRTAWLHLAVVGLLLQAAYFALLYLALESVAPAIGALIVSLQPVLVALLAPSTVGEHVPLARWAGLLLGLLGAAAVIVARADDGTADAAGIALAVAGLVAITSATLYENRFGAEHHPVTGNLVQCSVALAATGAVALLAEDLHVDWTGELVISLTYLVLGNSIVSITLLLAMVRRGTASQVSALFFLVPPLAALIAWAILGESLPALAWVGMVIATAGVAIATRR
jgi:drug/metabolite transporter (DMT)-like permease